MTLQDVVFDDDGIFGQNVVRRPSKKLSFQTVTAYMKEIFDLSMSTPKFHENLSKIMPFFRLPAHSLRDAMIPTECFAEEGRVIFNVQGESLSTFRDLLPQLTAKYKQWMGNHRSVRELRL